MAKLTDYVTSEDVETWIRFGWRQKISAEKFAAEIFFEESKDIELLMLKEVLVKFGFEKGEVGAFLTFLDCAIRHKNNS